MSCIVRDCTEHLRTNKQRQTYTQSNSVFNERVYSASTSGCSTPGEAVKGNPWIEPSTSAGLVSKQVFQPSGPVILE